LAISRRSCSAAALSAALSPSKCKCLSARSCHCPFSEAWLGFAEAAPAPGSTSVSKATAEITIRRKMGICLESRESSIEADDKLFDRDHQHDDDDEPHEPVKRAMELDQVAEGEGQRFQDDELGPEQD